MAAATARPLSRPVIWVVPTFPRAGAFVAGAGAGTGAAGACAAVDTLAPVPGVGGVGGFGAPIGEWGAAAEVGAATPATPAEPPPGGSVGSFMVGDAVGLGGKLMRTVSFFACGFGSSAGLGGTGAPGGVGTFSAIYVLNSAAS